MKLSLLVEGSRADILAIVERLGCTSAEISVITARLMDGDDSQEVICDRISERERQILRYLMEGVSNKEIGWQLDISETTVKQHVRNLLTKIGVTNRTKAALWAQKHMSRQG